MYGAETPTTTERWECPFEKGNRIRHSIVRADWRGVASHVAAGAVAKQVGGSARLGSNAQGDNFTHQMATVSEE